MAIDPYAYNKQTRRVYGYFDSLDKVVYVGSSYLPIEEVEYNHRNSFQLWPNEKKSKFRKAIKDDGHPGTFKSLIELECTRPVIEDLEGQLIRALTPYYNEDMDPVRTSKWYERY